MHLCLVNTFDTRYSIVHYVHITTIAFFTNIFHIDIASFNCLKFTWHEFQRKNKNILQVLSICERIYWHKSLPDLYLCKNNYENMYSCILDGFKAGEYLGDPPNLLNEWVAIFYRLKCILISLRAL